MLSAPCLTRGWQLLAFAWGFVHIHDLTSGLSLGAKTGNYGSIWFVFSPLVKKKVTGLDWPMGLVKPRGREATPTSTRWSWPRRALLHHYL